MADRLDQVHAAGSAAAQPGLIEARLRDGFGVWRETESSVSDQRDVPEVAGLVVHIRDVGERKEMERTLLPAGLRRPAHRPGQPAPAHGLDRRAALGRPGARARCCMVELDGFTAVNDVRGYDTGDAVLVEVARRLRAARRADRPAGPAGRRRVRGGHRGQPGPGVRAGDPAAHHAGRADPAARIARDQRRRRRAPQRQRRPDRPGRRGRQRRGAAPGRPGPAPGQAARARARSSGTTRRSSGPCCAG